MLTALRFYDPRAVNNASGEPNEGDYPFASLLTMSFPALAFAQSAADHATRPGNA